VQALGFRLSGLDLGFRVGLQEMQTASPTAACYRVGCWV